MTQKTREERKKKVAAIYRLQYTHTKRSECRNKLIMLMHELIAQESTRKMFEELVKLGKI